MPPEPVNGQGGAPKALTSTHRHLHCAATQEGGDLSELDRLQLDHFLDLLSEVAIAVVRRKALFDEKDKGGKV
jgi:hypothetical protein